MARWLEMLIQKEAEGPPAVREVQLARVGGQER